MNVSNTTYDYIILGAGASGMSLLTYLMANPKTQNKSILIIDESEKKQNDRTWCFWEKETGAFDALLTKKWKQLYFHSPAISRLLDIEPYRYKLLRSKDFYAKGMELIHNHENITFLIDKVLSMEENKVVTQTAVFQGTYIFNSIFYEFKNKDTAHHLLQHFKGWYIKTQKVTFDPEKPVMMDFRIPQTHGCSFIYILPLSTTHALIEYTIFSERLLEKAEYVAFLDTYIQKDLNIREFEITEREYGVIPMSNAHLPKRKGQSIINIGTAGGNSKPSTGYTFLFIQRYCQAIVENLAHDRDPLAGTSPLIDKYKLYDSIFLRVLKEQKIPAWTIFHDLFSKLPPELVLDFLDENTSLLTDFHIMNAVNKTAFLKAALREVPSLLRSVK